MAGVIIILLVILIVFIYRKNNKKHNIEPKQDSNLSVDYNIATKMRQAEIYHITGKKKFEMHDFKGAIAEYNKAIEMNPYYAFYYSIRGSIKANLNDYQGAISDFTQAIELSPKNNIAGIGKLGLEDKNNLANNYMLRAMSKKEIRDIDGYNSDMERYQFIIGTGN